MGYLGRKGQLLPGLRHLGRSIRFVCPSDPLRLFSLTRELREFGMPSFPDKRTVDYWLDGDTTQAKPQSKLMQQHNKAGSHERRFAIYMNENFSMTSDLETCVIPCPHAGIALRCPRYAYLTRLMASEAVGWAYTSWRREWKGRGKEFVGEKVCLG